MIRNPLDEESKKYRKEFNKLYTRSDYYRQKCAEKALTMSRMNKSFELVSFALSIIIVGTLSAALSNFIPASPAQKTAIILSSLIACLNAIIKPFFNPGEFVKLFYAAGEFLEIRERATKLKLQCGILSSDELRIEYQKLNDEYTSLKKAYIEYMRTFSYRGDRRRRKIKILGKKFTELPPMRRENR